MNRDTDHVRGVFTKPWNLGREFPAPDVPQPLLLKILVTIGS